MDSQDQQDMREALAEMQQLYGADSPEFLAFVENLSMGGNVFEKKYEPVPIKQFIEDPYFMGGTLDEIWPNVITSVTDVIEGGYEEAIFDGCISRAKTTRATIVNAYQLYVLSCYVSPQKALGLMSNSDLYMVMLNKTMLNAQRVTYAKFRKLIETMPYFRENFKHDPNIESEMRFPNGIFVIASNADNDKLMGLDVIGGCFPPDQKFVSSSGQLEVMGDNIGVEQSVLTTDVNDQVTTSSKTKVINTGKKPLVKLIFDNGETIVCTPDQKFKDENNNWVKANDGKGRKFRFNKLSDLREAGNLLHGDTPEITSQDDNQGISENISELETGFSKNAGATKETITWGRPRKSKLFSLRGKTKNVEREAFKESWYDNGNLQGTIPQCYIQDCESKSSMQGEVYSECFETTQRPRIQEVITERYKESSSSCSRSNEGKNERPLRKESIWSKNETPLGESNNRKTAEKNNGFSCIHIQLYRSRWCSALNGIKDGMLCGVSTDSMWYPVGVRDRGFQQKRYTDESTLCTGLQPTRLSFRSEINLYNFAKKVTENDNCNATQQTEISYIDGLTDERVRCSSNNSVEFTQYNQIEKSSQSQSVRQEVSLARCIEVQSFSKEPTLVYDVENTGSTHVFFAPTSGGKVAIQAKNCIDEINFYAVTEKSKKTHNKSTYNQALTIYNGLKARITSRFEGIDIGIKGCMCVVSSRAYKDDFTGNKIKEIKQREKDGLPQTTYLSTGSFWSFAPQYRKDGSQRYSDETFLLAIGSDRLRSEIIDDVSEAHGREVIDVPENYRQQFKEDIERGIRDFAGTVSGVTGSYFTNPEIVWAATDPFVAKFQRIFTQEEWDLSLGLPDINPNYRLYHPLTPRFIHLDLSLTGDNTGIGIAHSITDEKVRTSRLQPSTDFEKAPIIIYDDFLAINPPEVGEISYASIRKLLYYLMDVVGLKIKWVSADTYNSNDMLQILAEKRGIETTKLSVEKEEPYLAVKNAYNEERVILAPHEMAINELLTVVLDDKGNIDHLAKLKKDLSDAMVGCYTNMMKVHAEGELYTRHKQMMRSVYTNLGSRPLMRGR